MTVRAHGVETVYQDLALFDNLAPAANFFAGRELAGPSWLPRGLRLMQPPGDGRRARASCSTGCRSTCPTSTRRWR